MIFKCESHHKLFSQSDYERRRKNRRMWAQLAAIARATLVGVLFASGIGAVLVSGMVMGRILWSTL